MRSTRLSRSTIPLAYVGDACASGGPTLKETALFRQEMPLVSLDHRSSDSRSRGEFASSLRARKYQNLTAVGIASNGFLNLGFIGSSATNTRSVGPRVQTYSAVGGSRRPLDGRRLAEKTESPRGSRLLPVKRCQWRPVAGDWQTAANAGAYWSRIFRKCFEIRGSVIVWKTRPRKLSNIGVTIRIIVALTTKLSQYGAR